MFRLRIGLKKMAEPQDGGFIGQPTHDRVQLVKLAIQQDVMQRLFMAGSNSPNHCCMKWMRGIVDTANGGRPVLQDGA